MRNFQPLPITVPPNMSQGIPGFEGELSRVTVLLGANGTGKSKLLLQIKGKLDSKKVVYVEGGRVVRPPDTLKLNRNNFNHYPNLVKTRQVYESRSPAALEGRIESTFMLLKQRGVSIKSSHSDAVMAWINSGEVGPCPKIGSEPLEDLFELFHDLFPQIMLSYDPRSEIISCIKKGYILNYVFKKKI